MDSNTDHEPRLLAGTAKFIKDHLIPVNTAIGFSVFMVAGLDFLKPLAPDAVLAIYAATGLLAIALLLAGVLPSSGLGSAAEAGPSHRAPRRITRSPALALGVALLALITLFGWCSHAKAGDKGFIAGNWDAARALQASLGDLRGRMDAVQASADIANAKLDKVLAKQATPSPSAGGDACPDFQCALGMGASEAALNRLLARGSQLPTDPAFVGSTFDRIIKAKSPSRMAVAAMYLDIKALPGINERVAMVALHEPRDLRAAAATLPPELRDKAAGIFTGRNACAAPMLRLIELAALNRDKELYAWLLARGADPNLPNQWCEVGPLAIPFTATNLVG